MILAVWETKTLSQSNLPVIYTTNQGTCWELSTTVGESLVYMNEWMNRLRILKLAWLPYGDALKSSARKLHIPQQNCQFSSAIYISRPSDADISSWGWDRDCASFTYSTMIHCKIEVFILWLRNRAAGYTTYISLVLTSVAGFVLPLRWLYYPHVPQPQHVFLEQYRPAACLIW